MTLRWVPGWNGLTEPEAVSYVAAVEAADGQELEFGVAKAINDFVLGCKNDGIWDAIKASCILAGARTLNGALVPLVGTAPTNFNFVAGDYNRETGLGDQANASKYLLTNTTTQDNPANNKHLSAYSSVSFSPNANMTLVGGFDGVGDHLDFGLNGTVFNIRLSSSTAVGPPLATSFGFFGAARSDATDISLRQDSTSSVASIAENQTGAPIDIRVFSMGGIGGRFFRSRLAFYSIGEALDLAALDTRVTRLVAEITFTLNTGLSGASYDIDTINYINAGYAAGGTLE